MSKFFFIFIILIFLVGCTNPQIITRQNHTVVIPQDSFFECNTIQSFPDHNSLTDLQVARLLVELYQNNMQCKNSIEAIRTFLHDAKRRLENNETTPNQTIESPSTNSPRRRPIRRNSTSDVAMDEAYSNIEAYSIGARNHRADIEE